MRRFPSELADLLSRKGERALNGGGLSLADPKRRFLALEGLLDVRQIAAATKLLDAAMLSSLSPVEAPIPPETIYAMKKNYSEWLPKTLRLRTAYLERKTTRAYRVAEQCGLTALLQSQSFASLACALAGRPLRKRWGMQALCYSSGDYSGPHNDHHPEDAAAEDGYVDVHLTLTTKAVAHQYLVYSRLGHFSEMQRVSIPGLITAYRLPFWHYTTPLVAKRGAEASARRWVLLGTFLYARATQA